MLGFRSIGMIAFTTASTSLYAGDWSALSKHPLVSLEQNSTGSEQMLCQLDTNRPDHDFRFDTPNRTSGWWSGSEFAGLVVNGFVITTINPKNGSMVKYKMNDSELQRAGCNQPPAVALSGKIEVRLTGSITFNSDNKVDTSQLHCQWKSDFNWLNN